MKKAISVPRQRHQEPFLTAHARRQAEEDRREARRIDGDQNGGQRIDQKVDVRHPFPRRGLVL